MYRIGEFSYLFQLTIKTLRYYDEIDLFKPSYKDSFTGYRYYSEDQKEELKNILMLKEYGFTLEEIKELKNELSNDKIVEKIKTLEEEKTELDNKITKLEILKDGGDFKMKYKVRFDSNRKISIIGTRVNLSKRNQEEIDKSFELVRKKLNKLKHKTDTKVIITEEVGYKEEDVELFIGYQIANKLSEKQINKILKDKYLEIYEDPYSDYLVAINVEDDDIVTACKDIIEYSKEKKVQIIGPFIEIYDRDNNTNVYTMVHDLVREELGDELIKEKILKKYNEPFILDKNIVGNWKIKEILPNINFNPNKQKSNPNTSYMEIEFNADGTTNYENITWSKDTLFIKSKNGLTANLMKIITVNNKEYLEIRMNDMSTIYQHAKPNSYIYERNWN